MEDVQYDNANSGSENPRPLVKTLVPSPVVKAIFEADLRGPDSQDIVFVKEHAIELYSLDSTSFVLVSRLPINGTIRSAVPYIRPRKRSLDLAESIFSQHITSSTEIEEQQLRDIILCSTDSGDLLVIDWDLERPSVPEDNFPALLPSLRVMNALRQARPRFETTSLGRFVKVSEDSKWLAIGAWQEMFKLIRLEDRPRRDVHHRIVLYNDDKNEIVINETRMFYVEGIIWHFEFLKLVHSEGARFMVYILDESGQPKILLYDRPPTGQINVQSIRCIATLPLAAEFQCPLLTIPLETGNLCIIYEKELLVIDPMELTVGSHDPFTFRGQMRFLDGLLHSESGLITAYVKLPQYFFQAPGSAAFFLGSSKGYVYFISLDNIAREDVDLHVQQAFRTNSICQLHFSRRQCGGNILFVGGEMSDTVLYLVPDDCSDLLQLHTVPNWSPVSDCQLIGSLVGEDDDSAPWRSVDPLALAFPLECRDRLYVGAGNGPGGTIKELRTGLRTNVTVEFELEHVHRIFALALQNLPRGSENTQGYIVLTMTHDETKILRWASAEARKDGSTWAGDLDILDLTPSMSALIMTAEATLASSLIEDCLVQVTASGIYTTGSSGRRFTEEERIVQASIASPNVALVIRRETGEWNLVLMELVRDNELSPLSISQRHFFSLPREPTAVKVVCYGSSTDLFSQSSDEAIQGFSFAFCFVALRSPRLLLVYRIPKNFPPTLLGTVAIDSDTLADEPEDPTASEIHSIELIHDHNQSFLLLGMRHGFVVSFEVHLVDDFSFNTKRTTKFGSSQVEFISAAHHMFQKTSVFLTCEYLWEIRLDGGQLEIYEVLFDDFRNPRIVSGSQSSKSRELILLMDGFIRFVDVGRDASVWPRTIQIGQTPRRLIYEFKTQRMVITCNNIANDMGKTSNLTIVDILRNEVQVISPSDKAEEELNTFAQGFTPNALFEWRFRSGDKVMTMVCVGMGATCHHPDKMNGRVMILACRLSTSNKGAIRVKHIRKFQTKEPVYAIAKLDERHLIFSWGNNLNIVTFKPAGDDDGHRLENKETGYRARSPIIYLSVIDDMIYCSTLKDSLTMIQFDIEKNVWRAVLSDPKPRLTTYHFVLDEHIVVADKEGDLVGLAGESPAAFAGSAKHRSFKEVFQGVLRGPRIGDDGSEMKDSLIGVGIDGTVILIRTSAFYYLLEWIQNYWSSAAGLLPGISYDSKANQNALNVDELAFLVSRMVPGTRTPIWEVPEMLRGHCTELVDDKETIDLVLLARKILDLEFSGILL